MSNGFGYENGSRTVPSPSPITSMCTAAHGTLGVSDPAVSHSIGKYDWQNLAFWVRLIGTHPDDQDRGTIGTDVASLPEPCLPSAVYTRQTLLCNSKSLQLCQACQPCSAHTFRTCLFLFSPERHGEAREGHERQHRTVQAATPIYDIRGKIRRKTRSLLQFSNQAMAGIHGLLVHCSTFTRHNYT